MKVYKLFCDDASVLIWGEKSINLTAEVKKSLKSMSYDAVVNPIEDWFEAIVARVCEQTGFTPFEAREELYVEDLYFDEVSWRASPGV